MKNIAKLVTLLVTTIIISLPALAKYEIVETNSNGFTVVYTPELKSINTVTIQGNEYSEPIFNDAGNLLNEIGYPQILGNQKTFAIPSPTEYKIANVEVGPIKEYYSKIAPVYVLGEENYVNINDRAYKNRPLEDWANVEYMGVGRDLHLAKLNMIAAKYNPAKSAIEVPEYIKVTIKFNSNYKGSVGSSKSDLQTNLLNSNVANNWKISDKELFGQIGVEKKNKFSTIQGTQKISSGDWFKISIKENGVYELTADYLKDNGISIPNDKLNTIKIIGNGGRELPENPELGLLNDMNQQPITVRTNSDGSLKSIVFFGAAPNGFEYVIKQNLFSQHKKRVIHYINHFSNENHYLLTWGGDERQYFEAREQETGTPDLTPTIFTRREYFEEELVNAFHSGAGKQFFGRTYFSEPFKHNLNHLADEGNIMYRLTLGHKGADKSNGTFTAKDHNKLLSDNLRLSLTKDDLFRALFDITIPISEIPNREEVELKFDYTNNGNPGAKGVFDYYELHYDSKTKASNGEVYMFSDPKLDGLVQYDFTNFNGDVYAFDISDIGNPVELVSPEKDRFTLKSNFVENEPKAFFISSNLKEPINIQSVSIANLRDTKFNNDVIVITNKKLKESAKQFKEYRESNSDLDVGIFYVDDIYNEYNAGTMDISAIRDFIAQAMANWDTKPKYLVLWGDGHYDYRGIVTNDENLVPPHESEDENSTMVFVQSYSTDDFYARVVGNDRIIDLAVGRLAVNNEQEGKVVLDKIKHYENNSEVSNWRTQISIVADDGFGGEGDGDGDGALFVEQSEEFSLTRVPKYIEQKKIYSVEYQTQYTAAGRRKPSANADILKTVNEDGTLLLNWYGHGNPQVWSHEAILDRDVTVRQMVNYDRLFFLTAATCDFAKFDNTDSKSGAETMLLNEYGGAIGVFASARVVYASNNHSINRAFYNIMFTRDSVTGKYPTMGEILYNLKLTFNGSNDEKYLLLGDPTTRLLIPESDVVINEINGIGIADSTEITAKGLQTVKLSGFIRNPITNDVDTDFNGRVKLKVFDGDIELEVTDVINRVYRFRKNGGTLANANYEVINGKFDAEFILPKDISFSENKGKILAYAFTDDDRNAKGSFNNLIIDGLATTSVSDNQGPSINIFLDSRSFQAGDVVRDEPLLIVDLEDESGINSTGVGVGHKIEAWIDDNTQSIDLTSDYEGSFVDYRKGTSSKILLNLEPGAHLVKVRAWDIFNNYSVAETYFNINSDGTVVLTDVSAAPTPFADGTNITFNHNMNPPIDADLDIFDASGKKIKSITKKLLNPFEGEFQWDGTDNGNVSVNIGTYYFRIKLDNLTGNNTFLKGRTVKIK